MSLGHPRLLPTVQVSVARLSPGPYDGDYLVYPIPNDALPFSWSCYTSDAEPASESKDRGLRDDSAPNGPCLRSDRRTYAHSSTSASSSTYLAPVALLRRLPLLALHSIQHDSRRDLTLTGAFAGWGTKLRPHDDAARATTGLTRCSLRTIRCRRGLATPWSRSEVSMSVTP